MICVAISGDYSAVTTTAQLPPSTGSTSVSFIVEAFEDSVIEGEENFFISLSEPSEGARVGEQSRATVVIEGEFRFEGSLSAKRVAVHTPFHWYCIGPFME